jgi:hypothetical protein
MAKTYHARTWHGLVGDLNDTIVVASDNCAAADATASFVIAFNFTFAFLVLLLVLHMLIMLMLMVGATIITVAFAVVHGQISILIL